MTTAEYAIDYVRERYLADDNALPRTSLKYDGDYAKVDNLEAGLVLSQTSELDIIVLSTEAVEYYEGGENPILIVDRSEQRVVFEQLLGGPCEFTFEFIDLRADSTMALKKRRSCSTAGTGGSWNISIHRLNDSFAKLFSIHGAFLPSHCPGVQLSDGSVSAHKGNGVDLEL